MLHEVADATSTEWGGAGDGACYAVRMDAGASRNCTGHACRMLTALKRIFRRVTAVCFETSRRHSTS